MKYKTDTLVQVYKGTPTLIDGEIGKIVDRDPLGGGYAFASLEDIYEHKHDILNHVKWVDEPNLGPITFEQPKKSYGAIIGAFLLGAAIGAIGLYGCFAA